MNNLLPYHVFASSPMQRNMKKEKDKKKTAEKDPVLGQQIGMYSKNEDKDVRQMVRHLIRETIAWTTEGNHRITLV